VEETVSLFVATETATSSSKRGRSRDSLTNFLFISVCLLIKDTTSLITDFLLQCLQQSIKRIDGSNVPGTLIKVATLVCQVRKYTLAHPELRM
jgi:hypothetical protein